jgi:holliday junction DNA helicase RuvA
MISYIKGEMMYRGSGFIIINNQDIGYKVYLPDSVLLELQGEVEFYLHEAVRDSEHELFGFQSAEALEIFWKLVAISGVGARSAQKIVYADTIDNVRASIMKGDLSFLTAISGIGKKSAQKIILELKGVLAEEPELSAVDTDALDALISLGYKRRQAEEILSGIDAKDTEDAIKQALKQAGTNF